MLIQIHLRTRQQLQQIDKQSQAVANSITVGMDQSFQLNYLGVSADRSGTAHNSSAAASCVVSEKTASLSTERAEVAKVAEVTCHDYRRNSDGLALVKSTEEKLAILHYGEEQLGREKSRSEGATAVVNNIVGRRNRRYAEMRQCCRCTRFMLWP